MVFHSHLSFRKGYFFELVFRDYVATRKRASIRAELIPVMPLQSSYLPGILTEPLKGKESRFSSEKLNLTCKVSFSEWMGGNGRKNFLVSQEHDIMIITVKLYACM